MPRILQGKIVAQLSKHPAVREVVELQVDRLRAELGDPGCTILERTVIDQIVLAWLHVQRVELLCQEIWENGTSQHQVEFWDKQLGMAYKRYQRAVESLARVRHLLNRAGVQINIANNQVINSQVQTGRAGSPTDAPD